MNKIRLGRTDLMVTGIGLGGIPIQRLEEAEAIRVVERCLDLGLNFIDTANGYTVSEERIGKAVKGRKRQDVIIATKTFPGTADDIRRNLDLSLKRLQTDYIDIYQFHQVGNEDLFQRVLGPADDLYSVFEEAKKAGKIRHIGVTSHQIDIAKKLVTSDKFETLMFPFNVITSEPADELLPLCRKHDVGFIDMKPMAGGMLYDAPVAFKWLFRFPDIALIPGIEKIEEIEEIVGLYEGHHEMTPAELTRMQALKEELGTRFCRRCDYCQPCPQGIPISMVMTFPSFVKRLPQTWFTEGMVPKAMNKASECIECGECETRCPYDLPIREMLKENYDLFEKIQAESTR
jgi:predicted aldo/keto reductase-like oxidoreductase